VITDFSPSCAFDFAKSRNSHTFAAVFRNEGPASKKLDRQNAHSPDGLHRALYEET
jgi:hypothetical protein